MPDERTEIALEAAAKVFHQSSQEMRDIPWDQASEEWRDDVRAAIRPLVEAALTASDAYMAAAAAVIPTPRV